MAYPLNVAWERPNGGGFEVDTIEMEDPQATLGAILRETQTAWTAALARSGCNGPSLCSLCEIVPLPQDTSEDDLAAAQEQLRNTRPPFESQRVMQLLEFENLMDIHFLALEPGNATPAQPCDSRRSSLPGQQQYDSSNHTASSATQTPASTSFSIASLRESFSKGGSGISQGWPSKPLSALESPPTTKEAPKPHQQESSIFTSGPLEEVEDVGDMDMDFNDFTAGYDMHDIEMLSPSTNADSRSTMTRKSTESSASRQHSPIASTSNAVVPLSASSTSTSTITVANELVASTSQALVKHAAIDLEPTPEQLERGLLPFPNNRPNIAYKLTRKTKVQKRAEAEWRRAHEKSRAANYNPERLLKLRRGLMFPRKLRPTDDDVVGLYDGVLVWARDTDYPWWPAEVMCMEEGGMVSPHAKTVLVVFFEGNGTRTRAEVKRKELMQFGTNEEFDELMLSSQKFVKPTNPRLRKDAKHMQKELFASYERAKEAEEDDSDDSDVSQ